MATMRGAQHSFTKGVCNEDERRGGRPRRHALDGLPNGVLLRCRRRRQLLLLHSQGLHPSEHTPLRHQQRRSRDPHRCAKYKHCFVHSRAQELSPASFQAFTASGSAGHVPRCMANRTVTICNWYLDAGGCRSDSGEAHRQGVVPGGAEVVQLALQIRGEAAVLPRLAVLRGQLRLRRRDGTARRQRLCGRRGLRAGELPPRQDRRLQRLRRREPCAVSSTR